MKPSRLQNVLKSFGRAPKCIKILWPDSKIHEILENSCEFLRNFLIFLQILLNFSDFLQVLQISAHFCYFMQILRNLFDFSQILRINAQFSDFFCKFLPNFPDFSKFCELLRIFLIFCKFLRSFSALCKFCEFLRIFLIFANPSAIFRFFLQISQIPAQFF